MSLDLCLRISQPTKAGGRGEFKQLDNAQDPEPQIQFRVKRSRPGALSMERWEYIGQGGREDGA